MKDRIIKALNVIRVWAASRSAVAGHIALTTVHEMDILWSWNCRHIANAAIQARLRRVVEKSGFALPVLCTGAAHSRRRKAVAG